MRIEKKLYNHAFDVAFSIETNEKDPGKVTSRELTAALLMRLSLLVMSRGVVEACGHVDTYEKEESNNG